MSDRYEPGSVARDLPSDNGGTSRAPAWHEVMIPDPSTAEDMPPTLVPVGDRPGDERLAFRSLYVERGGLQVASEVLLHDGSGEVQGTAAAAATETGTLRSAANATVDALNRLAAPHARFELEQLTLDLTSRHRWVRVEVACVTPAGVEPLAGAALVRQDDQLRAAVRAVLDAVNRRLEQLLDRGSA